ncbi:MAG: hypothetical protein WC438_03450 [Candidatus Pacearchaeota archaeon]
MGFGEKIGRGVYVFFESLFPQSFENGVRNSKIYKGLEEQVKTEQSAFLDYQKKTSQEIYERDKTILEQRGIIGKREELIDQQKARIVRDNNYYKIFPAFFEMPVIRRIPLMVVDKDGNVYAQTPKSKKDHRDLKYRGVEFLDKTKLSVLGVSEVKINKKEYLCHICPLESDGHFDYSLVYLNPKSKWNNIFHSRKNRDKEFETTFRRILKRFAELNQQVDNTIQLKELSSESG